MNARGAVEQNGCGEAKVESWFPMRTQVPMRERDITAGCYPSPTVLRTAKTAGLDIKVHR